MPQLWVPRYQVKVWLGRTVSSVTHFQVLPPGEGEKAVRLVDWVSVVVTVALSMVVALRATALVTWVPAGKRDDG